jgi:hypothetical protein
MLIKDIEFAETNSKILIVNFYHQHFRVLLNVIANIPLLPSPQDLGPQKHGG